MAVVKKDTSSLAGFTLLEVLVVMTLIALLASLVTFSISGNDTRQLQAEGERMQQMLQAISDEAVLQGCEMGITLTENTYGFARYDYPSHGWKPLIDNNLKSHTLPEGMQLALTRDKPVMLNTIDHTRKLSPALLFSPNGEMTPFRISLSSRSSHKEVVLNSDGISPVALKPGDAP